MPGFDDLLDANQRFAASFDAAGFDGIAHAGVAILTCMDSRLVPLEMVGLEIGDAKILRTPGGRLDPRSLEGIVLAVNLLGADRVMVICHTRCAMASNSADELRDRVADASGADASGTTFHAVPDQLAALADDVRTIRSNPLVPGTVTVGGFVYDVDTGLLDQKV